MDERQTTPSGLPIPTKETLSHPFSMISMGEASSFGRLNVYNENKELFDFLEQEAEGLRDCYGDDAVRAYRAGAIELYLRLETQAKKQAETS